MATPNHVSRITARGETRPIRDERLGVGDEVSGFVTDSAFNEIEATVVILQNGITEAGYSISVMQDLIDDVISQKVTIDANEHLSLGDISNPQKNIIYWVGRNPGPYDIYIWVNNAWRHKGNTAEVDLSNYARISGTNTFTGNNNFNGNLSVNGGLFVNGQPITPANNNPSVPNIIGIRIPGNVGRNVVSNFGGTGVFNAGQPVESGITIMFDRPAPANCFIQFHRYSRRTGSRGNNNQGHGGARIRECFRPIDIDSAMNHGQHYWVLRIPQGATSVTTASIRQLYRPPRLRGPNSQGQLTRIPNNLYRGLGFRTLSPSNNPHQQRAVNRRYANKCLYKFSVLAIRNNQIESSPLSGETLEIMNLVTIPLLVQPMNLSQIPAAQRPQGWQHEDMFGGLSLIASTMPSARII